MKGHHLIGDRTIDFLVIGAQKAGTTTLHRYLSCHEQLYVPIEKEIPFFSEDAQFSAGFDRYFDEHFKSVDDDKKIGTVTPQYMMNPNAPGRIRSALPSAKLIALLRHPVERAYSHYLMATRRNNERRTFAQAIEYAIKEDRLDISRANPDYWRDYVTFGEYGRILQPYFTIFPRDQILIVFTSDLKTRPSDVMAQIFALLDVDAVDIPVLGRAYNTAGRNPLSAFFAQIALGTPLRSLGRILPHRARRRIRLTLAQFRHDSADHVDTSFTLPEHLRARLDELYEYDAKKLFDVGLDSIPWLDQFATIKATRHDL